MKNDLLNSMMLETFGEKQLTYANRESIEKSNLSKDVKDFFLSTGLPNGFCLFRFFMNPTLAEEDIQLREYFPEHAKYLHVFGTKLFSPFILIEYKPEDIGLNKNSNVQDFSVKAQGLKEDNIYRLYMEDEVLYSPRICIDTKNNDRIILISPASSIITFLNTNIQSLALSILAYAKCRSTQEFVENMLQIDPPAIDDNEKWWKQMTYELDENSLYMESIDR